MRPGRWLLALAMAAGPCLADDAIPYVTVSPGQGAVGRAEALPPPTVVPFSKPPPVFEVEVEVEVGAASKRQDGGREDAIFEQIQQAPPLSRCLLSDGSDCGLEIERVE